MNNITNGKRLKMGFDYFAKGFNPVQLNTAFYRLTAEARQDRLLLECASFDEIDSFYNPGDSMDENNRLVTEEMIMESVRVRAFSRTAQTMSALARAMNKQMADKGFAVGDAIIGKPKKSGLFATVTVQLPISDGQTISIIFHSPDNNKMKIAADDEILAFRWLLNKRDITVAVSPEGEEDVSLEEVGKRVAMLIEKNAVRFAVTQQDILAAKKALEDLKTQVDAETANNQKALDELRAQQAASEALDNQIAMNKDRLTKIQDYNDKLQSQLDALKAVDTANKGKDKGEGQKTAEEIKAEQDSAEFEKVQGTFKDELIGRGFAMGDDNTYSLVVGSETLKAQLKKYTNIGYGVIAGTETDGKDFGNTKSIEALAKTTIPKALTWIDKKLGTMKKADSGISDADFESAHADFMDMLSGKGAEKNASGTYTIMKNGVEITANLARQSSTMAVIAANAFNESNNTNEKFHNEGIASRQDIELGIKQLSDWIDVQIPEKAPEEVVNPQTVNGDGNQTGNGEQAMQALDDILAGKYSNSTEISDKLDEAATELERFGLMELPEIDQKLNAAADYLTDILKKEAA